MKKRTVVCLAIVVLVGLLAFLVFHPEEKKEKLVVEENNTQNDLTIGILFHGLDMLGESVFAYADYIEQHFNVKFEFATFEQGLDPMVMVQHLLDANVDAIINVSTGSLPELVELCEANKVYLLQIWDTPYDTDILEKYIGSSYYLGQIMLNERQASYQLAEALLNHGCESIAVISQPDTWSWVRVHKVRADHLIDFIKRTNKQALSIDISLRNNSPVIETLAQQGRNLDGLVTTENNFHRPLEEIQDILGNDDIKLAHFDLTPESRDNFMKGNLVAASCGHHNIVGLAFSYLYYLSTIDWQYEKKLDLMCDYLILRSVEDYDFYMETCVETMPYSAEQLDELIESLHNGTELLEFYCNNYSLDQLRETKRLKALKK